MESAVVAHTYLRSALLAFCPGGIFRLGEICMQHMKVGALNMEFMRCPSSCSREKHLSAAFTGEHGVEGGHQVGEGTAWLVLSHDKRCLIERVYKME